MCPSIVMNGLPFLNAMWFIIDNVVKDNVFSQMVIEFVDGSRGIMKSQLSVHPFIVGRGTICYFVEVRIRNKQECKWMARCEATWTLEGQQVCSIPSKNKMATVNSGMQRLGHAILLKVVFDYKNSIYKNKENLGWFKHVNVIMKWPKCSPVCRVEYITNYTAFLTCKRNTNITLWCQI